MKYENVKVKRHSKTGLSKGAFGKKKMDLPFEGNMKKYNKDLEDAKNKYGF